MPLISSGGGRLGGRGILVVGACAPQPPHSYATVTHKLNQRSIPVSRPCCAKSRCVIWIPFPGIGLFDLLLAFCDNLSLLALVV